MSGAEKWLIRCVWLSLLALVIVLAIGHIPSGG